MTHGLDTSVVVRIISGLPEGAAEKVGERIAADIAGGDAFTVSALDALTEGSHLASRDTGLSSARALQSASSCSRTTSSISSSTGVPIRESRSS